MFNLLKSNRLDNLCEWYKNCEQVTAFARTWARSGELEFFLDNAAQEAVFQLMIQTYNKAHLTGNPEESS